MSYTVGNDLDSETLGIGDCLIPALAIAHYAWKLKSFRDPAAVFLPIQVNRQIHSFIIHSLNKGTTAPVGDNRGARPGGPPQRLSFRRFGDGDQSPI